MAAPVYGSAGTVLSGASSATAAVPVPSGVATNDIIFVFLYLEANRTVTVPSGFTLLGGANQATTNQWTYVFWKRATGADSGTYSFTFTSTYRVAVALRVTGAVTTGSPIDAFSKNGETTSGASTPPVSLTTTGADRLLLWFGSDFSLGSWTPPSGFTERVDTGSEIGVASSTQAAAGSTGSVVGSSTGGNQQTAWLVAVQSNSVTPIASTDAAAGTEALSASSTTAGTDTAAGADTPAVLRASATTDTAAATDASALLRLSTSTDASAGAEALFVTAIDHRASTDTATGAESLYVDIPELLASSDPGTGVEALAVAATAASTDTAAGVEASTILRATASTDSAAGADVTVLLRISGVTDTATGADASAVTSLLTPSDAATGTEAIAILRISAVVDSGTGLDVTNSGPLAFDYALGTEDISIVEIAFTQVLPLVQRVLYDLVVVAMVPNSSGPPAYLEIDPIEWSALSWVNTLSQPQELSATCLVASVSPSVLLRLNNLEDLPTELWLFRNGRKVFAGPLLAWKTAGEQLQLEARGLLAYLQSMIVDSDLKYAGIDQHLIVKGLVDQWQALELGHLGIDTSEIAPSGVLRSIDYIAAEQHVVARRVEELGLLAGGFDADVEPTTRALQLWSPTKGTDRSTGEDAIILDSRNITQADLMCSVAPDDLASESYGTASVPGLDEPLVSKLSNAELRAKLGRRGVTRSFSNIGNQSDLDAANQAVLDARGRALIVPGTAVRVTPDSDLVDYGVGDTIGFDLRSPLGFTGSFRIRRQQVTVTASGGQENVDLQFV